MAKIKEGDMFHNPVSGKTYLFDNGGMLIMDTNKKKGKYVDNFGSSIHVGTLRGDLKQLKWKYLGNCK